MPSSIKKIKFIIAGAAVLIICFGATVPAQALLPSIKDPIVFEPQIGIPGFIKKDQKIELVKNNTSYIARMVKGFYDYGLGIGGILAAIVLMAAGIIWLTSGGSSEKISQAKSLIAGSITGLFLLFCSWMILKTINPYLLNFKIKDVKSIVPMFIGDGADGFIDELASLPEDTTIKYKCLGVDQTCADTIPPSTQLDISLCKKNKIEPITCSGNTPQKWCCAISKTITQDLNEACADQENGTPCKVSATDTISNSGSGSGFCFDEKCNGGIICCQCYSGYLPLTGLYLTKNCKNDLSTKECNEYCAHGIGGYAAYYYPGGSTNYTCTGRILSSCNKK